jgi:hypothetical protein
MPIVKPVKGAYDWDVSLNAALDALDAKTVTVVTVPTTSTSTGVVGNIAYNSTHLFVCVGTNSWIKVARVAF